MARNFQSTDVATSTLGGLVQPRDCSITAWVKSPRTDATFGRVLSYSTSGKIEFYSNSTGYVFDRSFTTTSGIWTCSMSGEDVTVWHHIAVTYSGASTSQVPAFYFNAASKSVVTTTAPVGTASTGNTSVWVGNRNTADRPLHTSSAGLLCWVCFHNCVLSPAEVTEAYQTGYTLRGLWGCWPMLDNSSPEPDRSGYGYDLTLTGTTYGDPGGVVFFNTKQYVRRGNLG